VKILFKVALDLVTRWRLQALDGTRWSTTKRKHNSNFRLLQQSPETWHNFLLVQSHLVTVIWKKSVYNQQCWFNQ